MLWPADRVTAGDWTPVQWFNPKLALAALEIGKIKNLRTTGNIHHWKISGSDFRATFKHELNDEGDCFATIKEDVMQTIMAIPESIAIPKKGKEKRAQKAHRAADHALLACRFRTTSTRVAAVYSETPAVGGAYNPIGVKDKELSKEYIAFLNSSFGIIQLLNRRNKTLTYIHFEVGQAKTLLLPDPNKTNLSPLLDVFEEVKNSNFERLEKCNLDPIRQILDHAVAKVLDFDPTITDQWREWLSQEPTITNKPYSGDTKNMKVSA